MSGSYQAPIVQWNAQWYGFLLGLTVMLLVSLLAYSVDARQGVRRNTGCAFFAMLAVFFLVIVPISYWTRAPHIVARVDWSETGLTLYPRRGDPLEAAWAQVRGARAPTREDEDTVDYGGSIWISVWGRPDDYRVALSNTPDCRALLSALRAHTTLVKPGETLPPDGVASRNVSGLSVRIRSLGRGERE